MQHAVPKEILTLIGDMTVSWSLLEMHMQMLFGVLLGADQRTQNIITSQLGFRQLRIIVLSLYLEKYGEDENYTSLKAILSKAKTLEAERNRITHSVYGGGREDGRVMRLKMKASEKTGFKLDSEWYDPERLRKFSDEIRNTASEILSFVS